MSDAMHGESARNNSLSARDELERAKASLEEAARHLQRAGHALHGAMRGGAATALGDCEYTTTRVTRLLDHLRVVGGGR